MTTDEILILLRAECEKAGGQTAWAKRHGISSSHVSDVMLGRKDPAQAICAALGLKRVMNFERI